MTSTTSPITAGEVRRRIAYDVRIVGVEHGLVLFDGLEDGRRGSSSVAEVSAWPVVTTAEAFDLLDPCGDYVLLGGQDHLVAESQECARCGWGRAAHGRDEADLREVDLDEVARLVRETTVPGSRVCPWWAYVEQTGGGCATVYVHHGSQDPVRVRPLALCGPGWFTEPGWNGARALLADCAVGPDDDGVSTPWFSGPNDTAETIAAQLVRVAREEWAKLHPEHVDAAREVVSVGWDGRSRPILRYADELHLPDHARSVVRAEDRGGR